MKARPIIFQGHTVCALVDDRKTHSRRIVNARKSAEGLVLSPGIGYDIASEHQESLAIQGYELTKHDDGLFTVIPPCPYSQPGDLLWVRESFRNARSGAPIYRADKAKSMGMDEYSDRHKWKSSIYMPRWASRLTLRITDVRVERVQDISEDDAVAEGLRVVKEDDAILWYSGLATEDWGGWSELWQPDDPVAAYRDLWESINGNWDENPWVWVLEFEVIQANVDHVLGQAA